MYVKVQLVALVYMPLRLLSFAVKVVNRMLVECLCTGTVQDVI